MSHSQAHCIALCCRAVLGTFANQIDTVVGLPDPGQSLTLIYATKAALGVAPANGAWVVMPALVVEAAKDIYHAAAINGDLAYAYGRWGPTHIFLCRESANPTQVSVGHAD